MNGPPSHFNYHSHHLATPQDDVVELAWEEVVKRCDRIRVQEHSCICMRPMYELCAGGGLWFVRRLSGESLQRIVQTTWMPARAARQLWMQILTGYAR